MTPYPQETVEIMVKFYNTLSEKDKRRYAATEAVKLGHGGVCYIALTFGCARSTVHMGISELLSLEDSTGYHKHIRRPGAGRKRYDQTIGAIDAAFLAVVENHTAGSPMEPNLRWTNLTHTDIAQRLSDDHRICVSKAVVPQLLKKHGFVRRKAQKKRR